MALAEVFRLHARLRGRKPAIREGGRTLDYAGFDRMLNSAAASLRDFGVRRGDIVGVSLRDRAEHLAVLFALARMGAVVLPMDWRWTAPERSAVTERYGPRFVLAEELPPQAPAGWIAPPPQWFAGTDEVYADAEVTRDSPYLLSLSSGTTGVPKGPCVTQQQYENRFMAYWINLTMNAHDRFVLSTPLYHGGGRGFAMATLFAGATVCLFPPPYSPRELAAHVAAERGTSIFLVPTLLRRLLDERFDGLAFPTLKKLISSGSALYREERVAVRERLTPNLFEIYSSTEGGAATIMGPEDMERAPESVGRPAFRVDLEIVDDQHRSLPAGEVGRLRYRSPASPRGYFIGDSSDAFRDGWFYPGDLASLDEDGFLYLKGRIKDMIIRGGVNIFPGDVEKVLLECEAVSDAAVVGAPSREFGEELAAFVVSTVGITREALLEHCRTRLAPYKVPRIVHFMEALPRNSSGKVLKADLVQLAGNQTGGEER
jgi:acyl-CoA synthetase (AMP-forming)/AMP-acid ligase II